MSTISQVETAAPGVSNNWNCVRHSCTKAIDDFGPRLRVFNREIHSHPETAYQEFFAVETITSFLESEGYRVRRNAYGLDTSFEAEIGTGGRLVVICIEYDALPNIGHACGHNLIATSSLGAFLGAARALQKYRIAGRVRILGTPAEEGGGGKVKLIEAGAFDDNIAAAIMAHPLAAHQFTPGYAGLAGLKFIACHKFRVEFRGKSAHAGGEPWNGVNALDAAVSAYNNISMLRQQMRPDERVHGVIEDGGTVPNVITDYSRMNWYIRSPSMERCDRLLDKVQRCCQAAANSTSCTLGYTYAPTYMNLRVNKSLCQQYVGEMASIGETTELENENSYTASTDMGNVSYKVPSFHGAFPIPTAPDVSQHHPEFATAAATDEAHQAAMKSAKGMGLLALQVLINYELAREAKQDFDRLDEP